MFMRKARADESVDALQEQNRDRLGSWSARIFFIFGDLLEALGYI